MNSNFHENTIKHPWNCHVLLMILNFSCIIYDQSMEFNRCPTKALVSTSVLTNILEVCLAFFRWTILYEFVF